MMEESSDESGEMITKEEAEVAELEQKPTDTTSEITGYMPPSTYQLQTIGSIYGFSFVIHYYVIH